MRAIVGRLFAESEGARRNRLLFQLETLAVNRQWHELVKEEVTMFSLEEIRNLPSYREGLLAGLERGRQEGWAEGRHEGEAALLVRQLTRRFGGPLPAWVQDRLAHGSEEDLLLWSERVLEAADLGEVFSAKGEAH